MIVIKIIANAILFFKVLFWTYIACAVLAVTWANYLNLQNEIRVIFFVAFGCMILFFLYGFFKANSRFSKLCTIGTIAVTGSCIGGFCYLRHPIQLTILASLYGASLFVLLYFYVKQIDYLNRYLVLILCISFGATIGGCLYYLFDLLGFVFIGGGMGFAMVVIYLEGSDEEQ